MDAPIVEPTGIIREAFEIYRAHFAVLFPLALIVGLVQAIALFALRGTGAEFLALAVALIASMLFQGVAVELVNDTRGGRAERAVGDLLRAVAPILLTLFSVSVLAAIGIIIGVLLLVVPGLILLTIWAVVAPVVVIERTGVFTAFGRSRELVRGHGLQVFAVVLLVLLLVLVAGGIASAFTTDQSNIAGSFAQLLISSAVAPIAAVATAALYFRLVDIHQAESDAADPNAAPPEA